MEKIDILLATYNGEKYLKEQLDSILAQTYSNFRLLISDDKSSDTTIDLLQEYAKKDERIILFLQEKNLGSTKNFEFLLSKVISPYYMFSDQDDIWLDTKVEKTYQKLIEENADLVFTDLEVINDKGEKIASSFNQLKKLDRKIKRYHDFRLEYLYNVITGCTMLSKSMYIQEILPLPENKDILHDYWIGLLLSLSGKICYLEEATIRYRQHEKNQVGASRYTDRFTSFDEKRNHCITVKISQFQTYCENEAYFPVVLKKQNEEVLAYFKHLMTIKTINFKGWKVFHHMYRYETLSYYLAFFVIMNIPGIARFCYKIGKRF